MSDDVLPKLAKFGIVDIDWSNAKKQWSAASPMDCQERLVTQAEAIKKINPTTKVFVYRNIVKALPWFTDVREKITDPQYAGWFLPFKPKGPYHVQPCDDGKCSSLYHDYEQTPRGGDCGHGLPCGEYLFDHRNESLRNWIIDTFMIGSVNGSGVLNPSIDGYCLDDGWQNHSSPIAKWGPRTGFCNNGKIGGPTEEQYQCDIDMGLDQNDTTAVTEGWYATFEDSKAALVKNNAFSWELFDVVTVPPTNSCVSWFQGTGSSIHSAAMFLEYSATPAPTQAEWETLVATFLIVRGPYAWMGTAWDNCHSTWIYPWSDLLDKDYGVPLGDKPVEVKPGVFQREWSKVTVSYDCSTSTPTFTYKQ